jgi:putative transposase
LTQNNIIWYTALRSTHYYAVVLIKGVMDYAENDKYERVGHLFQDRYKSEPVESDAYLLSAVRYIHKNPVKAGIVKHEEEYKWSSFNEYIIKKSINIVDTEFILNIFNCDMNKAVQEFVEFSKKDEEKSFIEIHIKKTVSRGDNPNETEKLNRKDAEEYIEAFLKKKGIKLDYLRYKIYCETRQELILFLRTNTAMSIREIADMLDINRGMVEKVKL